MNTFRWAEGARRAGWAVEGGGAAEWREDARSAASNRAAARSQHAPFARCSKRAARSCF